MLTEVSAPTVEALQAVLHKAIARTMKLFTRQGVLIEEEGLTGVADQAGWDKPLPRGVFRGVAQFMGYGSYTVAVAEVTLKGEEFGVKRIVPATNHGHALNPDQIAGQVEGSVAYGMDSMLCVSRVAIGRFVERNFDTYPVARMKQRCPSSRPSSQRPSTSGAAWANRRSAWSRPPS